MDQEKSTARTEAPASGPLESDADRYRARPGYRWRAAMRCSGKMKEVAPPCPCPCHVANAPYPSNWYCDKCHSAQCRFTTREDAVRVLYSHEQAIADGEAHPQPYMVHVADYYFLTNGNNLDDAAPRRRFKTPEAADRAAERLNNHDAIASLNVPASHLGRFRRYRKLHKHFGWWWYDGKNHPLTRLPSEPGRYAVESWGDDGDSYWNHHETLDAVRDEIQGGDVRRVIDLDTGKEVPFVRSVSVDFGGSVKMLESK